MPTAFTEGHILVIHGCLMVLRRLLVVLWVLVLLLLVVRHVVDAHITVIAAPLRIPHGSGGEVGRRHHDWGLHALLPNLAGAALLCLLKNKTKQNNEYIYNPIPWLLLF